MKTFEYRAVSASGASVTGRLVADDELRLDRDLENQGLTLTTAKVVRPGAAARGARMSRTDLVSFTTQLATVISAGVPIVQGIRDLSLRMTSPSARAVLLAIVSDLEAGNTLSEALGHQSSSFPFIYRASVEAGEMSGALPRVLRRMAKYLDWVRAMRATTMQALIYPTILCFALIGLVTVLLTFVLPRIVGIFPGGREDLPRETKVVIALSEFLTGNAVLLVGLIVALGIGGWFALKDEAVRQYASRMGLRLPKFGPVVRMLATSKFAATAATLHNAGCDVSKVLSVSGDTCGNAYLAAAFARVGEGVRRGQSITECLEREDEMDPLLIQMVAVGEQSGDLGGTLEELSRFYDQEVPRLVKLFLSFLEPAILLSAGFIVAFIILAALLPIFSLYESI